MSVTLRHLTKSDYILSQWSGGSTVQLAIGPEHAVYADRDFLFRISSATVTLAESDFTPLPGYDRFISVLDGSMTLTHDGGAPITLSPFQVHAFSGAASTHSVGRCTDFNLMLRRGRCTGDMACITPQTANKTPVPAGGTVLLYCVRGKAAVTLGAETVRLLPHEAARITADKQTVALLTLSPDAVLMRAAAVPG